MTLLYLALVLPLDEILSPLVFGEELQLLGINGAPPLLPDQVDRVLVLHSQLNQRCCNQHRRSAKPSDTVNTNTCVLVFLELCVYQREPPFNDLLSRCRAIREGELRHCNTTFAKVLGVVGLISGAHQVGDAVLLQKLDVGVHCPILWLFSNEEPHVVVLDLGGNGADSRPGHLACYEGCPLTAN